MLWATVSLSHCGLAVGAIVTGEIVKPQQTFGVEASRSRVFLLILTNADSEMPLVFQEHWAMYV